MFAQRTLSGLTALACAILIGLSGCKKETSSGGGSTTTFASDDEIAKAKIKSINNLKQIGIALHCQHDARGHLPTAGYEGGKAKARPSNPWDAQSWRVQILPYLEQAPLYDQLDALVRANPFAALPESITNTAISTYQNPLAKNATTPYRVFVGGGAMFEADRYVRFPDILDGMTSTIMVVEAAEPVAWSSRGDIPFDLSKPLPKLGIFPGGFHALMGDGTVRWIPLDTPESTIKAMITRAGGELVNLPGKRVDRSSDHGEMIELPVAEAKVVKDPILTAEPARPNLQDVEKVREAAAKASSRNNLKQIGIAFHNHEAVYAAFPSPGVPNGVKANPNISSPHSWRVAILPFIEQENVWNLIPNNAKGPIPKQVSDVIIKPYLSPLNRELKPQTNYRVFVGNNAAFEWGTALKIADFTDGLSNTILAVECADPIDWTSIDDFKYDPKKPLPKLGGVFPGGFHALMGDGAVIWIPDTTPEETIRALITRNGGETVSVP